MNLFFIRMFSRNKVILVTFTLLFAYQIVLNNSKDIPSSGHDKSVGEEDYWNWRKALCQWSREDTDKKNALNLQTFIKDVEPVVSDRNIYLIETSCDTKINARILCALESLAWHNPSAIVWLLVTVPSLNNADGLLSHLKDSYSNIRFASLDITLLFQGTLLEEMLQNRKLLSSRYLGVQMSDLARAAVVWRYGGIYTDCDVICLQNLDFMQNMIAFEDKGDIANAVFHFQKGHPLLELFMKYVLHNFNPGEWTTLGPDAMSAVVTKYCQEHLGILKPNSVDMPTFCPDPNSTEASSQFGVSLFAKEIFYPLHWERSSMLLTDILDGDIDEMFPETVIMHLTGSSTFKTPIDTLAFKTNFYTKAARLYCPTTLQRATLRNRFL